MSGLVWPEAAQRIANSAYLTRERVGRGQVILFSGEPNFRGAALGTNRLWLNAVVYGAGLGASSRITP
jgi:precorrin-6B methylase 1